MNQRGLLFVVAAPSGAGKTTLCKALMESIIKRGGKELSWSVSYTTRSPREGEADGRDYHFVDEGTFESMAAGGEFAEWAAVHGRKYGTSKSSLEQAAASGLDLLMEIDIQGARQLRDKYKDACFIFILPPSWDALVRRLRGRGTEPPEEVEKRLLRARQEILEWPWFDYIIINDDFDKAVDRLCAVVTCMRSGKKPMEPLVEKILRGLEEER
jgi:guanylate kinase